jgi:deoxycytidine triphosphate deaminase
MYLSHSDIQDRLKTRSLVVDPAQDLSQIAACEIDLHVGTTFAVFEGNDRAESKAGAHLLDVPQLRRFEVPIGEEFVLPARSAVVAVTLEYLMVPMDLPGIVL